MNTMPSLGMGTFRLEGETACKAVTLALETGYLHIDTVQINGNEAEVGQAIAAVHGASAGRSSTLSEQQTPVLLITLQN